jgi:hypothetical protein
MEQLMALGVAPDDPDSATKTFADLKAELEREKVARETAHIEVDTLTQAVKSLKISADNFSTQIHVLEEKVKHLENKVFDGLNEVQARELCLELTTKANDDYKSQNTQLTQKLESKFPWSPKALVPSQCILCLTLLRLEESDAELNALKAMVKNTIAFFYTVSPPLVRVLLKCWIVCPTMPREIILTNMKQSACLTLGILKSLYRRADMDVVGEGFAATCSDNEAWKLVEDSAVTAGHIVDMLPVNMSLG